MGPGLQHRALAVLNPTFLIGVNGVVIDEGGRILLLKHSYRNTHPWGLPSGWVRRGEQPEETLRREVLEEVGLKIKVISVLDLRVDRICPRLDVTFLGRPAQPVTSVRPRDSEIVAVGFFEPGRLPGRPVDAQSELIKRGLSELGYALPGQS